MFIFQLATINVLLLVYVDNVIIIGNKHVFIQHLISYIGKEFAIKDFGHMHYFLGVSIKYFPSGIFLSLTQYIKDLLVHVEMTYCSKMVTPKALKQKLVHGDNDVVDATFNHSIVGNFQYLTFTYPDITHGVNQVYQYFAWVPYMTLILLIIFFSKIEFRSLLGMCSPT